MNKVKQIIFAKEKRMISSMVDAFERENKDTVQMKISGTNVSISIEELLDYNYSLVICPDSATNDVEYIKTLHGIYRNKILC